MERRTLLKGAAWSLPVIAEAVAVPDAVADDWPDGMLARAQEAVDSAPPVPKPVPLALIAPKAR